MKPLSNQELRASMVRDYAEAYRRAGLSDAQATTIADARALSELTLVDAAERNGQLRSSTPNKADDRKAGYRPDLVSEAYADAGTHRPDGDVLRFRSRHAAPQQVSERWGYAVARIGRILEGAGRAAAFEDALQNAQIPHLARKFSDLNGWFMTMWAPPPYGKADSNPFRGMNAKDASRKFMRLVEDICDESTGVLGSWYVK